MKSRRLPALLTLVSCLLISLPAKLNAVTFGQEETDASSKYPWAVPILYYERNATEPSGLCTGTLIESDVVLTAAHCVPSEGFFEVKYGLTSIGETGKTYTVNAAWVHPRYSKSKFGINDVALLKLREPIQNATPLSLASSSAMKKAEFSKNIRILGWGEDQNGEDAIYLRSAKLDNQSSFLTRLLGKRFNKDTWVAAGKYNSVEKVYAGGCRGDSGGPLVAIKGERIIQIGITSFGAENCETAVPTIFMKTSYFVNELKSAIKQLGLNAAVNDRSPPENLTPPLITGNVRLGSSVVCASGQWSSNVSSFTYKWESSTGFVLSTGSTLLLADYLAGQTIRCTVTGNSRASSLSKTVELSVPNRLTISNQPSIIGLPKNGYEVAATNVLTCSPATASGTVESSTFYWILRNSSWDTSGQNLGTSSTLTLPSSFFQSNNQKDLVCVNTLTGPGGSVKGQANGTIYAPQLPTIYYVEYSGFNNYSGSNADAWIGTTLTCKASSSLPSNNSLTFNWRLYESNAPYYPTTSTPNQIISTGPTLLLTESLLKNSVMKRIGCSATATSLAGSTTGFSTLFYVDYRNISAPDLTPPTFSLISIKPLNGPDFRLRDPIYIIYTAGDSSGLSQYLPSFRAILNGTEVVPISTNGNLYTYPGGTRESTKFEWSLILPGASSGGKLGQYEIQVFFSDNKGNSTGWKPFASFEVTGERTN